MKARLAACIQAGVSLEVFFPESPNAWDIPRSLCNACPQVQECLLETLKAEGRTGAGDRHGMFGGLTPHERSAFAQLLGIDRSPTRVKLTGAEGKRRGPAPGRKTIRHGTASAYTYHRCRCPECRAWGRATQAAYRDRKRRESAA